MHQARPEGAVGVLTGVVGVASVGVDVTGGVGDVGLIMGVVVVGVVGFTIGIVSL